MNEITQQVWGFTPVSPSGEGGGEPVVLYTMTNANGASVQLTNYGAAIVGVTVPDRLGKMADVVLGYDRWQSYIADGPAMGKSVGRYANRIAKGIFTLEGNTCQLAINNGPNHLHGGPTGFANRLWEGRVEGDRVVFGYHAADGEEGYPGGLYVEACYDWDDDNTLAITYYARLDDEATQPTIVNLTNHVYFNLNGHDSGSVLGHTLTLKASRYLPTDETAIPLADVLKNTTLLPAAELYSEESGRFVKVATTQPGIQIYTGNWLSGCPQSKSEGYAYSDRDGVAMECQAFPNTPNRPDFPSVVLHPGETYEQHINYEFGTR